MKIKGLVCMVLGHEWYRIGDIEHPTKEELKEIDWYIPSALHRCFRCGTKKYLGMGTYPGERIRIQRYKQKGGINPPSCR